MQLVSVELFTIPPSSFIIAVLSLVSTSFVVMAFCRRRSVSPDKTNAASVPTECFEHLRGPFHFYLDLVCNVVISELINKFLIPNYSPNIPL